MSSRLLKKKKGTSQFFIKTEAFFNGMISGYENSLTRFMRRPWISFLWMLISIVFMIVFGRLLPDELAPMEDKSRLIVRATAPEGTSYEKMDEFQQQLIAITDTLSEKDNILAVTSPGFGASISANSSFVRVNLVPKNERKRSQQEIADQLSGIFKQYNFARIFVSQEQTIGGNRFASLPVQFVLQAPTLKKLEEILPEFLALAAQDPAFQVVDVDLKFNKPELQVTINRDKASEMGVSVRDVAEAMQLTFSGQRYGYFIMSGKQYEVIGQATKYNRDDPEDLKQLHVRNKFGQLVPLDNLITMREASSPPQLYRYNRYVSATISANPSEGKTIGDGIEAMEKIADELLDETFSTALAGTSKEFAESGSSLFFAFGLALVLVYLVLAAQFESFADPLVIMLTVPLALAGAFLTLYFFDQTLNIFSKIGIIVLVGLVTKNGILIVEFANQRKESGLSPKDAVIDAAAQRFRPILMTSLATILGALPIALALGDAATSRIPMGMAIIGGLTFSLVLTLYVIPGLYVYLTAKNKK